MHFWSAAVSELEDSGQYSASFALLSDSEKAHAGRFRFERDRNAFVASRALRRRTLSQYAEVEPGEWEFTANEYGRPRIAYPQFDGTIEFNCSRSADLVVCAVTSGIPIGVDIERLDRKVPSNIPESAFAASEKAALEALPRHERGKRFFTYWTLKEAYLKARSRGLSLPLDSVAFTVADRPHPVAKMVFSAANDCSDWQFTLLFPTPSHIAAVCVRGPAGSDPRVDMRRL